jgi:hypothetical protein
MRPVTVLLAVAALACSSPVLAQGMGLAPEPPRGVLWTMKADGDAIQNDLGFIVPMNWKEFRRQGFSSTRPDGGSVKAYYLTEDKALTMTLWIQLRADIRGLPLDADTVWSLMQIGVNGEFGLVEKDKYTKISEDKFSLGGRTPEGRQQWQRVALEKGPQVQGAWWQNIGVWSVVITFSGPEARRAELEAAANTLFEQMPFPGAPITVEMAVNGDQLLASMPKCDGKPPEGEGKEVVPTFQHSALYALVVPNTQMGQSNNLIISPVTHAKDYCVIEAFSMGKDLPVTAIQYRGAPSELFEPRYAFVMNGGRGGIYQLERVTGKLAQEGVNDTRLDQVYLHFTNNKRAELITVFDDWPSYKQLKKSLEKYRKDKPQPIISTTKSYEKLNIQHNTARVQDVPKEQP